MADDISDDAYLLEVMASHAALVFRPDAPKAPPAATDCRCPAEAQLRSCEDKIDALTRAFAQNRDTRSPSSRTQGGALALTGALAGVAVAFLIRRKQI